MTLNETIMNGNNSFILIILIILVLIMVNQSRTKEKFSTKKRKKIENELDSIKSDVNKLLRIDKCDWYNDAFENKKWDKCRPWLWTWYQIYNKNLNKWKKTPIKNDHLIKLFYNLMFFSNVVEHIEKGPDNIKKVTTESELTLKKINKKVNNIISRK